MAYTLSTARLALPLLFLAGGSALLAGQAHAEQGNCVDLRVEDVRNAEGILLVALFTDEPTYLDNRGEARSERIPAIEGTVSQALCGLPSGRYALSLFHDEDVDTELDTNFIGIPTEGYGFAGEGRGYRGKPSFETIAFELGPDRPRHQATVKMTYWF